MVRLQVFSRFAYRKNGCTSGGAVAAIISLPMLIGILCRFFEHKFVIQNNQHIKRIKFKKLMNILARLALSVAESAQNFTRQWFCIEPVTAFM